MTETVAISLFNSYCRTEMDCDDVGCSTYAKVGDCVSMEKTFNRTISVSLNVTNYNARCTPIVNSIIWHGKIIFFFADHYSKREYLLQ